MQLPFSNAILSVVGWVYDYIKSNAAIKVGPILDISFLGYGLFNFCRFNFTYMIELFLNSVNPLK